MPSEIELDFKINEDRKSGVLKLGEELTIQGAVSLKDALSDALRYVDTCILDLVNVTVYDLSCIQILYSAYTTAETVGKQITLSGSLPIIFEKAVSDFGFSHLKWFGSNE